MTQSRQLEFNLPNYSTNTPNKSIRSQIENPQQFPEGYAERAKLVYKTAEKEQWSKEQTMIMLRDPQRFARFMEIVKKHKCLICLFSLLEKDLKLI